ncbi:MAG TPA: DUF6599 family protein [Terriglobia bacterium]|nr:DUF6599 family protein [Terriglobia bacterium]
MPAAFGGWEGSAVQLISIPQLVSATGDAAAVFREYGFLGAERRQYSKAGDGFTATLWRLEDATGSYGLFTFLSQPGMRFHALGNDPAASGGGVFLLQRGPYVLELRGDGLPAAAPEALSASIPASQGTESLLPPLPGYLPTEGLIPASQKFLIGPAAFSRTLDRIPPAAVRFDMGAEAVSAKYNRGGDQPMHLLLISYPTPQLASKMLREFQSLPALSQGPSDRTLFVERKGNLIAFVLDAPSLEATEQLLQLVRYEADVTWNEYVPPPGQNAGSLMLAVFSLAGFILLIAFFSGLAFGGVRLIIKRFVPIPVFDRPERMELIRLHLNDT